MTHVLVLDGHPSAGSLCAALAKRYAEAARDAGGEVQLLALRDLEFDPDLQVRRDERQVLEPDLVRAQHALVDADHVVVVTPVWWGSVTALLKGFLDRTLVSGWAYRYDERGIPHGLLRGRTGRVVVTTDSPGWWLRALMGDTTVRQLTRSTLRFCGLRRVRTTRVGPVHGAGAARRERWLEQVDAAARADAVRRPRRGKAMPELLPHEADRATQVG